MKEECGSFLSVNVVTVNVLLSVFFYTGVFAECYKDPHLFITVPKQMEALSGSCLLIPCNFSDRSGEMLDGNRETFGVWIKSDPEYGNKPYNIIFNSSESENPFNMTIIGNLKQKNCTTLFYNLNSSQSDTYFFRIENEAFKATASCDPVNITVKDSPQRPRIEISGDVKDLKEKESVTITCSAFTPCPHSPPELTWNLQQDAHRQTEENTDGTFTTKIQQNITLSHTHDGYNITCSARYPVDGGKRVKTSETEETLSVSYAPKDTSASISPSGLVSAGSWVKLNCSSRAKRPVSSFTWFKISTEGPVNVSEGPVHSFNATDGGVYYCVAANKLGNQTSQEIRLNIKAETSLISALVPAMIAVCLLICLLLNVCYFKYKHPTSVQTQSGNQTQEEIFYEEMNHFKHRPEPSSTSVQDSSQQQEILCLQVNMSEPENSSTLTADVPKDHNIQSQTNDKLDFLMPAYKTNEECLYEVMNFFERRPEPSSVSVQDGRQQQQEEKKKESKPDSSLTQTTNDPNHRGLV
ncbi:B-cell receptor CD22-like isoform X1 [Melanotaenia boesemani]|uniref:B-cell receptor CD22-like isoform X1 n=1 Tax=Melanotaenia boesemani TaxID=1250792 RepID=UPI001C041996|nr:B-cell receptor CD22-like isoform X1 [Melanotaenia boesemani]